jgi:hypothetical protein
MATYPYPPTYTGDPNTPIDPNSAYAKSLNYMMPGGGASPGGFSSPAPAKAIAPTSPYGNFMLQPWQMVGQSALPPTTSLTSGPVSGYNPVYGGVPSVPNPTATQGAAIGGNMGNLGGIGQLSQGLGGINAGLGSQPYQQNLPNYQALLGQASGNALSNLQGNLPADVVRNIQQAGAERGVSTGSPSSPNANAAYLRALGLTSLGLQQTGQQQFGQLVGLTPTGPQFNPASLLVSPEQYQQAQAAQNIYGSAPIPGSAAAAAMSALQGGLRQGQGATSPGYFPTQSASLVQDVMNKYAPFQGGTPSYGGGVVDPYAQATQSSYDPYNMYDPRVESEFGYFGDGTDLGSQDFYPEDLGFGG